MFWNTFVSLCNKQHKSPNAVCAELNFSTATATKWKNGATPRDTTLQKIANYFGVTTDYLLGAGTASEFNPRVLTTKPIGLTPDEIALVEAYRAKPELAPAVRKLLDIPEPTEKETAV